MPEQEPSFGQRLTKSQLESAGTYYEAVPDLECDGLARVIISFLALHKVRVWTYVGDLYYQGKVAAPLHIWIEVEDNAGQRWHLDYRARMWCLGLAPGESIKGVDGLDCVPHGLIKIEELSNFPQVCYGRNWQEETTLNLLPIAVVRFLVSPLQFPPVM